MNRELAFRQMPASVDSGFRSAPAFAIDQPTALARRSQRLSVAKDPHPLLEFSPPWERHRIFEIRSRKDLDKAENQELSRLIE
jgi:hypothetical protein